MKNLLIKEFRLASSPLTYVFLAAAFMTMLPGYPILMGSFFICLGIFHSFRNAREANDTLYSVLLPVEKGDFVRAKYAFTCLVQIAGFAICCVLTGIRMTVLSGSAPYVSNALMNATPVYLAFVLLVFASFNIIFVGGFFRTAYIFGKPFLFFCACAMLITAVAEALLHIPGLEFLHSPACDRPAVQFASLAAAAVLYSVLTALSYVKSRRTFEMIDL